MSTVLATRGDGAVIIYDQDDKYGQALGHIQKGVKTYPQRPVVALLARGRWTLTRDQPVTAAIVRTPAGAKKYGQPIGSVIVRDVVPRIDPLGVTHIPVPPEVTRSPKAKIPEEVQAEDLKAGDVILRYDDALVRVLSIDGRDDDYTELTGVVLTGPTAGAVTRTSINNGKPVKFQGAREPQDFDRDVIAPVRARLDALKAKYPDGLATAIDQALTPPSVGPEPEMSDRLKEMLNDTDYVRWMFQEAAARDRLRALQDQDPYSPETLAAKDELDALHYDRVGGKIRDTNVLLLNYQFQRKDWSDKRRAAVDLITPHSDQAKEILAEVREIGQQVRVGIDIDLAQRGTSQRRQIDRDIEAAKTKRADLIKRRVGSRAETNPGHAALIEELRQSMQAVNDLEAQARSIPDPSIDPEYLPYPEGDARDRTRAKRRRARAQQVIAELAGLTDETKQVWTSKEPRTRIQDGEVHRDLTKDEKDAMTAGLLRYPASWVARFDRDNYTTSFAQRGWNSANEKHITISATDGSDTSEGSARIWATILHEQGHTMEKQVPGLAGLEAMWWHDRMGELSPKTFHPDDGALFPDPNSSKKKNIARPTAYPYTLKMYGNVYSKSNKSWEIFTTGVQEVLGDGKTDYTYNGVGDSDLWEFTMGALLTLDGQPAAPATTGV